VSDSSSGEQQLGASVFNQCAISHKWIEDPLCRRRRLCLKGAPGEEAVLCSSSKTFAVKTVETSNLVLLVHEEQQAAVEAPLEALCSHDTNLPVATPPGMLRGLATQLQKARSLTLHLAALCWRKHAYLAAGHRPARFRPLQAQHHSECA
jgi:hypothetical protein